MTLNKFALKINKCALNVDNDIKIRKNNQSIKNDVNVKSVSESRHICYPSPTFRYLNLEMSNAWLLEKSNSNSMKH